MRIVSSSSSSLARLRAAAMGVVISGGAIGLVTSSGGCSKSSDNGPPDTAHFAGALAGSFCGALRSCCDAAKIQYDDGSCVAQLQAQFQSAIDVVKHGKVIYDPNAVAACEAAIHDREAKCTTDGGAPPSADAGFLDPIQSACWPVLKGTVAPGQECSESTECKTPGPSAGGSCRNDNRQGADPTKKVCFVSTQHALPGASCRGQPATGGFETTSCEPTLGHCQTDPQNTTDPSAGTCVAYAHVGDDCISTTPGNMVICDPATSYCETVNTRQCAALPQAGEACAQSFYCAKGLYCDNGGGGPGGTCTAPKADGADCKSSRECVSGYCQQNVNPGDGGIGPVTGTCSGSIGRNTYDVSPRTCGFGPSGTGPEDGGIQPPAKGSSFGGKLWFDAFDALR